MYSTNKKTPQPCLSLGRKQLNSNATFQRSTFTRKPKNLKIQQKKPNQINWLGININSHAAITT
ncbi:hypothetical protein BAA08_09910 [Bizionia sp. APA-3]|nr:hypothetical protein BAA08_09910 [Bizionia sp. APA-3]